MKDMLVSFSGLALTLICSTVGCLNLPPAFSNRWRLCIFFGLLICYAIGYFCGMKKRSQKVLDLLNDVNRQNEFLANRIASDADKHENQVAGLRAAIDNEKRKNAELARRWEDLQSADRRMRDALDALLPRERALLAQVMDVSYSGHIFKAGGIFVQSLDVLVDIGFLTYLGEDHVLDPPNVMHGYTPAIDARPWLLEHRGELPAYGSKEYLMGGTILNSDAYHPVDGYPLT